MTLRAVSLLALFAFISLSVAARSEIADEQGDSGSEYEHDGPVDEALVAKALKASPEDLGTAFLFNRHLVMMTELASDNIQIHTPEGTIDKNSATQRRREFEERDRAYRHAIMQRGFAKLAGNYTLASVSPACERSGSLILAGAREGIFERFEMVQGAFDLTLKVTITPQPGHSAEVSTFEIEGVAVESSLVLVDPMNMDYYLKGKAGDDQLEIKPSLDVLESWPSWAGPPKKRDLEICTLLLQREEGDGF